MSIRPAISSDFNTIVSVLTRAFWNESYVSTFLHPKRDIYPDDLTHYWRRHIRLDWYDQTNHFLVAIDPASNEVVGVANWKRNISMNLGLYSRMSKQFVKVLNVIDGWVWPDRAVDPTRSTAYMDAIPFFAHHWEGSRASHWSLGTLVVLPEHEGMGYGRALIGWGVTKAAEDGVVASVVASDGTEGFYRKCGFDVVVGKVTDGEGNPLTGVKGGVILFRDSNRRNAEVVYSNGNNDMHLGP